MNRSAFAVEQPDATALRALNYSPYVEVFRQKHRTLRSMRLGDLLAGLGPAYGTVFTRLDCHPRHGIELLSQTDMFAAEPKGRVIRLDSMSKPERHEVKRWQVLIAGAGTLGETELYGRSIIADGRLLGKYVGPDAMALNFAEPGGVDNLYAYAFLCSPIGVAITRSASYGTKILRFRSDVLSNVRIPDADRSRKESIAALIRKVVEQRECYLNELQAARGVIEKLPEMQEALAMCQERKARCVVQSGDLKTLSAWRYASTGGAIDLLQRKWKRRLRDAVKENGLFRAHRFARIRCERPHGIDLFSQRDVFLIRPKPRRIVKPDFPDSALRVPEGALMVASQGTTGEGEIFGRVCYVDRQLAQGSFSEHLTRVLPREGESCQVYAFLSSNVGFRLLRSTAAGTKLMGLREDLLLELPYPEVNVTQKRRVAEHMRQASEARVAANTAEYEAARIIEQEVLPAWLS